LPDAMEGPTPVSALIHAATMVTAGVFLVIRLSFLFEYSPVSLTVLMIFGSLTAFVSSTIGAFQNDIKKIIAYSTCSQLGYMVFSCGMSLYSLSLFHLFNHGFFKALLFLSAGSVIHGYGDNQDIRRMGGLIHFLPLTYLMILIGSMSLAAIPTLSGFYSKDLILEFSGSLFDTVASFAGIFGLLAAFFTVFYSYKLIYMTFLSVPNGYKKIFEMSHEPHFNMTFGLVVLFFFSICSGYLFNYVFLGYFFIQNSIFVHFNNIFIVDFELFNVFFKQLPIFVTMFSLTVGYYLTFNLFGRKTALSLFLGVDWIYYRLIYFFFSKK